MKKSEKSVTYSILKHYHSKKEYKCAKKQMYLKYREPKVTHENVQVRYIELESTCFLTQEPKAGKHKNIFGR